MDTIYREPAKESKSEEAPAIKKDAALSDDSVEVPYFDYESSKGKPFLVDYFDIGNHWQDPDGGFEPEIRTIESYLREQIESGEIGNSLTDVKNRLKEMEKVNNLKNESRVIFKVETLAAYAEFLRKKTDIRRQVARYGPKYQNN